jgi:cell division initiation protein
MGIHKIDLLHPVFSRTFMGYAGAEVDEFLREIAEAIARLSEDKTRLVQKVAELEARLKDCAAEKQEALQALDRREAWSREKIDADKMRAKQEASAIMQEARAKAENIVWQGNLRLVRVMDEIAAAEEFNRELREQINSVQRNILAWLNRNKPARENRASGPGSSAQTVAPAPAKAPEKNA